MLVAMAASILLASAEEQADSLSIQEVVVTGTRNAD